jgi:tRNA 2-selenouridine synthase
MAWREISPQDFNALKSALVIDVRSPCEHEAERILDSINIPLLSDEERVEVGTMYKQQGDIPARRYALQIISPKIPSFVEQIASLKRHGVPVVIYCWRGGMRSESVSSVLSIAGIDCFRLTGGYKAWRSHVLDDLAKPLNFKPVILHGFTGCGKTELLVELAARGAQVLDLEALANHRGSVFGGLGLPDQPSQKNFDAAVWRELRNFKGGIVFMEGESRKIGRLAVPDRLYESIHDCSPILVTGSLARRAERIAQDYLRATGDARANDTARALQLLESIKPRLGAARTQEIADLALGGHILEAVTILLEEYYDPLYSRQIEKYSPMFTVNADDVPAAATEILKWQAGSQPISVDSSRRNLCSASEQS